MISLLVVVIKRLEYIEQKIEELSSVIVLTEKFGFDFVRLT